MRSIINIAARTGLAVLLLGAVWLGSARLATSQTAAQPDASEWAVKAQYLYKLAPFVMWPASDAAPGAPLAICVQGADPFGPLLDRAIAGQSVAGRPLVARRVAHLDPDANCAIAYVAGSASQSQTEALTAVQRAPVLTVTDATAGPARGIVHLSADGGQLRFSIDMAKAQDAGVEISSKLLALAMVTKP